MKVLSVPNGEWLQFTEGLRVAIVHYWFVNKRGGEKVVEVLADMFPQADLYALTVDSKALSPALRERSITTSFLQAIPGVHRLHRYLLPFYPIALEQFDLRDYDLVISSESGPAKGVITSARACHVCYCHSPMRYLWDFYHGYLNGKGLGFFQRLVFSLTAHYARMWDLASASRVDYFVANSKNVAKRIRKHYRRDCSVIYPPVRISAGYLSSEIEDYYLVVGQLVDYKRVDIAIKACNHLNRRLLVIGDGEQYKRLRELAGPTVRFLGFQPDDELFGFYAHCRALLFPGEEDFGIVPVEAQSFGRPVIAYAAGGVLETVRPFYPGQKAEPKCSTGVFFHEQSVDSMMQAMVTFEAVESCFSPSFIRDSVQNFEVSRFRAEIGRFIMERLSEFRNPADSCHLYTAV